MSTSYQNRVKERDKARHDRDIAKQQLETLKIQFMTNKLLEVNFNHHINKYVIKDKVTGKIFIEADE